MKKFMILMLSLAVLFSFAACDNSNANAPAGDDDQTVDTTDYAYVVANYVEGKLSPATGTGLIEKAFNAGDVYTSGAYVVKGVSYDATTKTLSYTEKTDAVGELPDRYDTIILSGKDVSTSSDISAHKTIIMLDSYKYTFVSASHDYSDTVQTISGDVKGDFLAKLTVENNADGTLKDIDIAVVSPAGKVLAFLPSETSDVVSISVNGKSASSENFIAYINDGVEYTAADDFVTSNKAYYDVQKKVGTQAVYGAVDAYIGTDATGLAKFLLDNYGATASRNAAVSSSATFATNAASATITYKNDEAESASVGSVKYNSVDYVFTIPAGETFTVKLESDTTEQTGKTFDAVKYTINGKLNVYASYTDATTHTANAVTDQIDIQNLVGTMDAKTITLTDEKTRLADNGLPTGFSFAKADGQNKITATNGDVVSTVKTPAGPALVQNKDTELYTDLAPLGKITIECEKVELPTIGG